ncbi:MAG: hypothetical protein KIH64_015725 [Mycobacterium sp.]|nr:hypothetical protein [Mycobacterium sp.]
MTKLATGRAALACTAEAFAWDGLAAAAVCGAGTDADGDAVATAGTEGAPGAGADCVAVLPATATGVTLIRSRPRSAGAATDWAAFTAASVAAEDAWALRERALSVAGRDERFGEDVADEPPPAADGPADGPPALSASAWATAGAAIMAAPTPAASTPA